MLFFRACVSTVSACGALPFEHYEILGGQYPENAKLTISGYGFFDEPLDAPLILRITQPCIS
jgi:hypothetical protein